MEQENKERVNTNEDSVQGGVEKEIVGEIKKADNAEQNFATEVFREFKIHTRFAICAMAAVLALGAILYYKNDADWRELFNSYDFISQDGEGINNINSGEQGDLLNGAEGEAEEGQDKR